jgi:hypothetical protein
MKLKKITLIIAIISSQFFVYSQIPNGGFENWTDNGAENDPDGWNTSNTDPFVSVTPYTPAYAGNFSMKVATFSPGFGVIPGIAEIEFPFSQRPNFLKACIKTNVLSGDKVMIILSMTNGDSIVASSEYCTFNIDSTISEYTCLYFPISYASSLNPTMVNLMIGAGLSNSQIGTYIIVDELSFESTLSQEEMIIDSKALVFPNPFLKELKVIGKEVKNVKLLNSFGQIMDISMKREDDSILIDSEVLPNGTYFLEIQSDNGITFYKCIKY